MLGQRERRHFAGYVSIPHLDDIQWIYKDGRDHRGPCCCQTAMQEAKRLLLLLGHDQAINYLKFGIRLSSRLGEKLGPRKLVIYWLVLETLLEDFQCCKVHWSTSALPAIFGRWPGAG
jgi:hypothetical protein